MASKHRDDEPKTIENRKARFDYTIGETLECGIVLGGGEVKSVRSGQVSLGEGYVRAQLMPEPALYLHGVNIAEYAPSRTAVATSPTRTRKLLAHKREIARLCKAQDIKGNTLVPLKIYFKNGYAKCLIGVGSGKTRGDKRQTIKERESQREIDRAMSRRAR
ncbi:MAG: SsrA-binding protein SmpB [Phycisphaerales bacterium]